MSKQNRFDSVWDALSDDAVTTLNLKLRASLMMQLEQHIKRQGWTQQETAQRLGVTQPRISNLMRGKITLFSLDTLINMAGAAGMTVKMHVEQAA